MTDVPLRDDRRPARVGLCATCRHADIVISSRDATFYRCTLSETDPAFPRYPTLPVRSCAGYQP
jgi:hypothetical protein